MSNKKVWLIVERLENWRIDKISNFAHFGISGRSEGRAKGVNEGDLLIVYVSSGISAFADVREVTSSELKKLRFGGDYDTAFPICIPTRSVFFLERKKWLPIKGLVNQLSFTKEKKDWRQVMRSALRVLPSTDADLILSKMKELHNDATT